MRGTLRFVSALARTPALFELDPNRTAPEPAPQHLMAKINGNEIRPGTMISYDGGLWMAVKTQKVKPGKGGAYNQVELKNVTQRHQAEPALPLRRDGGGNPS